MPKISGPFSKKLYHFLEVQRSKPRVSTGEFDYLRLRNPPQTIVSAATPGQKALQDMSQYDDAGGGVPTSLWHLLKHATRLTCPTPHGQFYSQTFYRTSRIRTTHSTYRVRLGSRPGSSLLFRFDLWVTFARLIRPDTSSRRCGSYVGGCVTADFICGTRFKAAHFVIYNANVNNTRYFSFLPSASCQYRFA